MAEAVVKEGKRKAKFGLPEGVSIDDISWETIMEVFGREVHAGRTKIESIIEGREKRIRLEKELIMTKLILMEEIKKASKPRIELSAKFLVKIVRLLERCDELIQAYNLEMDAWLEFLFIVIEKMKKEKLIVHKPPFKEEEIVRKEFRKMKDSIENM